MQVIKGNFEKKHNDSENIIEILKNTIETVEQANDYRSAIIILTKDREDGIEITVETNYPVVELLGILELAKINVIGQSHF